MSQSPRKYCIFPFENVEINYDGQLHFCCSTWQRKPFGDFTKKTISEEWNSPAAQEIRSSIIDGSYKFCDKLICPFIQSGNLKTYNELSEEQKKYFSEEKIIIDASPSNLMLNYDQSCNLSCESCRVEKISHNANSIESKALNVYTEKFTKDFLSVPTSKPLKLNITGSGDPFASLVYREFLENLDGVLFPNLTIDLQTNGVLFTPVMWQRIHKIHKNVNHVSVSVDAATEPTYNLVRRGGNWGQLLNNIEFLRTLRSQNQINFLSVNMVVQKRNYIEILDFVSKFDLVNIDAIHLSLVTDWNTWDKKSFNDHAIWKTDNPEHQNFLNLITSPLLEKPNVFIGNLSSFRKSALRNAHSELSIIEKLKFYFSLWFSLWHKNYIVKLFYFIILMKRLILKQPFYVPKESKLKKFFPDS